MLRWVPIFLLACLCLPSLAGPNVARYAATRASSDAGWDDPYKNQKVLWTLLTTNSSDLSDAANTMTVNGAVSEVIGTNTSGLANNGRVCVGFRFDGTDDDITATDAECLGPTNNLVTRLWSVWINRDVTSSGMDVFHKAVGASVSQMENGIVLDYGNHAFWYDVDGGWGPGRPVGATLSPATGVWIHVAGHYTYNNTLTGTIGAIYTNGVLMATNTTAGTGIFSGTGNLEIGNAMTGWTAHFDGLMTDFRMYTNVVPYTSDPSVDRSNTTVIVSNLWYNTGGKYTNQPWMSNENGY